ncbi:hypothetical protein [Janthinobacterium fluminis]|uniref:DUF1080 domain-containing protein n=1 Tax=Janthinobacterium fluminis TaxID=2987524 RepID=A0ABT5K009_9BURK|nr:hypothetical protein [Janthinobacterium fluminis]MDC8758297.1 hypothetical protein [Janthinobacterium fluminis]
MPNFIFRARLLLALPVLLLAACGGSSGDQAVAPGQTAAAVSNATVYNRPRPTLPITAPLTGVTIDGISNLAATISSLNSISKVPTTRIVFDEYVPANSYLSATTQIRNVSYVMGELLDSFYVRHYSVQAYLDRTTEYLNTLGNQVDIWEVGNEINGEWLGSNVDVVAKMSGAYDLVKARGKLTELTLYYNKNCWSNPANEMFTWAQNNIPARMKQGLDYVLVSYYEDDCNGLQPDWPTVFNQLHAMFPNSKIGFGEVGTAIASRKAEYVRRYYSKQINVPNYVGGYFWWYFRQDMVPNTKPLLQTLNDAINSVAPPPPPPPPPPPAGGISLAADNWMTVYNGYGSVSYDAATGIVMAPRASTAPSETHAALTLAKNIQLRNFRLSITATTEQQLRLNSAPNPWEVFWIFFNYTPTSAGKNTNYFLLKPNGVELGKAFDGIGQTFLYTGPASATALRVSNNYVVEKIGNHVTVYINGVRASDYTGALYDVAGSIGLYTEDARVRITNVQVTPL